MNKLTQQEANLVIAEAAWMLSEHPYLRFGQAIWNCCGDANSRIAYAGLSHKLSLLLDSDCGTEYDFFYFTDTDKVLEVFYKRYVGEV